MDIIFSEGHVTINTPEDFEPHLIFDCGQCFRWERGEDGSYTGVAFGKAARVIKIKGRVHIFCPSEDFHSLWKNYFDLDRNYGVIRKTLSIDTYTKRAIEYGKGIRILRQEPWEALCSFILSQCNNIARIRGIISRLCGEFGDPFEFEGVRLYAFPPAGRIAALSESDLAPLRCGYRAPYVLDAARAVASGEIRLERLCGMRPEDARRELKNISGVGDKVADCVLLFGLGHLSVVPVDVWMRRALDNFYDGALPDFFDEYGGIAQQYIFHYIRTNNAPDKKG